MFRPRRVSKLTFIPGSDVILRHSTRSQKCILSMLLSGILVNTQSFFAGQGRFLLWSCHGIFLLAVNSPLSSFINANFCLMLLFCCGVQSFLENVDKPPDISVGVVERGGRHPHHGAPATLSAPGIMGDRQTQSLVIPGVSLSYAVVRHLTSHTTPRRSTSRCTAARSVPNMSDSWQPRCAGSRGVMMRSCADRREVSSCSR